ncbi:MAG: acyl-CoA desaturase [Flavobacteriales bacterium]|nr:acyl-CoA desaturase [Flavobacteriales bacterium]
MAILLFFLAHWYLSLFVQTFFLHRYAAHQLFTMSPFWERFFYLLTYVGQGSSYLSAYGYGLMHRMHHAYADTDKDPHSPAFDHSVWRMMWRTKLLYSDIVDRKATIEPRFTKGLPDWRALDLWGSSATSRLLWAGLYTAFYAVYATHWWQYLLLPVHYVMGPLHGAIINWYAHKYGYRNYAVNDTSRNLWPIELVVMGEGLHNNHHAHSGRANFAAKWWEFDPTWPIIKGLHALGVIRLVRA